MRTHTATLLALATGAAVACGNNPSNDMSSWIGSGSGSGSGSAASGSGSGSASAPAAAAPEAAKTDPVAAVGVQAGGITHDAKEGPAGIVKKMAGTVEVRKVGEAKFAAAKADDKLYPGDVVRTATKSTATLALADQSVIELAEVTMVGIASRDGTANPASAAAVLNGVARFTVTPRAPAEGPFRVYTPVGFVVTKGTTYGVGVGADGQTRVGVETGNVEVVGLASADAPPVAVASGNAASLDVNGTVAAPAPWPKDDWGTWRDDTDAKVDPAAAISAHGAAMTNINQQLTAGYSDLDNTAKATATFETNAAAAADKGDTAAYQASLPDGDANIDASFAVGGRLEALTWANAGHAELANEIYVRHPDLEAQWTPIAPSYDAAILWPKRYEVTSTGYLEPLRMQYYVHEPRGRVHAELVGVAVPTFYAQVQPVAVDPVRVRAVCHTPMWIAPEVAFRVQSRPVWAIAPAPDWHAHLVVNPAPFRAHVGWYVAPPAPRATVFIGEPRGHYEPHFVVGAPMPRAELSAGWRTPVGVHVRVNAPDLVVASHARAQVHVNPHGALIIREHVHAPVVNVHETVNVHEHVGVGAAVNVHEHGAVNVHEHATVNVHEHVNVHAPAAHVEVHAPAAHVEVHKPAVHVEVKAGHR